MKKEKTETKENKNNPEGREVEVLYQRMGNRWYAFTLIDDEVFIGSIALNDGEPLEVGKLTPMYEKL